MEILREVATWFLIFLAYSCLGWFIEMVYTFIQRRRVSNRGFLIGPICPIYGTGAVIGSWILSGIDQVWLVFLLCIIGGGILEYITSFWMEACFHVRWWDYKDEPLNINGRTCLGAMLGIGVLGVLVVKLFTPAMLGFFGGLSSVVVCTIAATLLIMLTTDFIWSLILILHFRVAAGTVGADATDEITENIRNLMMNRSKLDRRLVKAFPNLEVSQKKPRQRTKKKSRQ